MSAPEPDAPEPDASELARLDIATPNGGVRLDDRRLRVEHSGRLEAFPYAEVARLRLSYRPRSLDFRVYRLDLLMRDGRTLALHNIGSTPGAVFKPYTRWDEGYAAMARALAVRVAKAAPQARLEAGFPLWRWAGASAAGGATLIYLAMKIAQASAAGHGRAALIAGIGALAIGAFLLPFLTRNRPRPMPGGAVPPQVLP